MGEPDTYLAWLREKGVPFEVASPLLAGPPHDGDLIPDRSARAKVEIPGFAPIEECRDPERSMAADHATRLLGRALRHPAVRVAGRRAVDLGCGSGVLATCLARMGAATVYASDLLPGALDLARATAAANGVRVDCRQGYLLEAFSDVDPLDLVVTSLPHKPAASAQFTLPVAQHGGPDGTVLVEGLRSGLPAAWAADGQLLIFLHTLPQPDLLTRLAAFGRLRLLAWRLRYLQPGEYGALGAVFRQRAEEGSSYMFRDGDREGYLACVWLVDREAR